MSSSRPDCRRIPGIALIQRCDAHHRPARSSNHEELPCVGLLHQAREVGFGVVQVHLEHAARTVSRLVQLSRLSFISQRRCYCLFDSCKFSQNGYNSVAP